MTLEERGAKQGSTLSVPLESDGFTPSNLFVTNKERRKEDLVGRPRADLPVCMNPKGPHDGERIPHKTVGIPIPQTEAWQEILKEYRTLAAQEGSSVAHVYRSALIEYYTNHKRGNPAVRLDPWITGEPFSLAAQRKLFSSRLREDHLPEGTRVKQCPHCRGNQNHTCRTCSKHCTWCAGRGEVYDVRGNELLGDSDWGVRG